MSNYDSLKVVTYSFPGLNMATGSTAKLKVPQGAQMARVLDILMNATVTFTQVTTPALVEVGDGTTANKFASLTVGALASGNSLGASDQVGGIFKAVYDAGAYTPALHDLTATFVAPTGGTPAGTANILIVVGYDQITP